MLRAILVSTIVLFSAFASAAPAKVVIGYFTKEAPAGFETKIKPIFGRFAGDCSCELRNLTPYNGKGEFDPSKLSAVLSSIPEDVSFLFFDWNERSSEQNREFVDALSDSVVKGRLVIASAGVPPTNEGSCPLSKTLMGQVNDSLIIGELAERDRLLPKCYFGPEILAAVRPPKDLMGQGYAPLLFSAKLAAIWNKRKPAEWMSHFKRVKANSKKIWPDLEDFVR